MTFSLTYSESSHRDGQDGKKTANYEKKSHWYIASKAIIHRLADFE